MVIDVVKFKENAKRATHGPWKYDQDGDVFSLVAVEDKDQAIIKACGQNALKTIGTTPVFRGCDDPDAIHIAGCDPPTIIALCHEIEYLRLRVKDYEELMNENDRGL